MECSWCSVNVYTLFRCGDWIAVETPHPYLPIHILAEAYKEAFDCHL